MASSLSLGVGYFLVGSSGVFFVVVDGYSAVSCDFGVFIRRGEFVFLLCHLADQLLPFLSIQALY